MSLSISFIFLTDKFNDQVFKIENDLFGFEICRKELWGNQKLQDLGCKIIPKLKDADLYIINTDLHEMYKDCQIILNNIFAISLTTNYSIDFIRFRIDNLLECIKIALENKDHLGINIS